MQSFSHWENKNCTIYYLWYRPWLNRLNNYALLLIHTHTHTPGIGQIKKMIKDNFPKADTTLMKFTEDRHEAEAARVEFSGKEIVNSKPVISGGQLFASPIKHGSWWKITQRKVGSKWIELLWERSWEKTTKYVNTVIWYFNVLLFHEENSLTTKLTAHSSAAQLWLTEARQIGVWIQFCP